MTITDYAPICFMVVFIVIFAALAFVDIWP